ncbi:MULTISPECIES: zinc-dependent alcohol dehydrogenase family protein [Streptomyces]|nr:MULTISPECIES: zinc-dependent alcohol dehydrogenase family protein [Streptomyces]PIB04180.1 hypothetical protein B1C81_33970 [Streptomyces sp. HG99]
MGSLTLTAVGGDLNETVTLNEHLDLTPGADEVVVSVEAAPINNADVLFAAGWFGMYPQVPSGLGAEGVGRVLRVGPGADPSLVGQRVLILPAFTYGTWANETVVPARNVIPVSSRADVLQLAMLPVNPATAHTLLNEYVDLEPGEWIGLNLANSAVGQYVIALAERAGYKTLAVVRREEAAKQVRQLGADLVLVDGEDLGDRVAEALAGARLRVLFEGTGDPAQVAELVRSVEDGGSVVTFSAATGQAPAIPLGDLIYRGISLRAFYILNWIRDTPREKLERVYAELAELAEQGVVSAAVEATYPLDQYQAALAHAQRTERSGKILFTPTHRSA